MFACPAFIVSLAATIGPQKPRTFGEVSMTDVLNTFPTVGAQTLRALARYPDRIAFSWPGGSITYRGTMDLIGRLQNVFMNLGASPGTKVALLTANRADTWCTGVAAQLSRFAISWLHPLGSMQDQIDQIEDAEATILIIDPDNFQQRWRRTGIARARPATRIHAGPCRLRHRSAESRRLRRQRHRAGLCKGR
jgi:acyl-coenzyme A synthetase/AMP-(fatty) acid ligase